MTMSLGPSLYRGFSVCLWLALQLYPELIFFLIKSYISVHLKKTSVRSESFDRFIKNCSKSPSLSADPLLLQIFKQNANPGPLASLYLTSTRPCVWRPCIPVPLVPASHTWCPRIPRLASPSPKSPNTRPDVPVPLFPSHFYTQPTRFYFLQ